MIADVMEYAKQAELDDCYIKAVKVVQAARIAIERCLNERFNDN